MLEKELKRQSREELLQLLLHQTKEAERLRTELAEARQQLDDRQLQVEQAGTLADAVVAVNGVMEAAQAAAGQYLENLARRDADAQARAEAVLAQARQEAEGILSEAEQIRQEAQQLRLQAARAYADLKKRAQELERREANNPDTIIGEVQLLQE